MAKAKIYISELHGNVKVCRIKCLGCDSMHTVPVEGSQAWGFNNDVDKPTLTPSILAHGKFICHSYVTNGMINYLTDSTHSLAGKQIELPEIDSND